MRRRAQPGLGEHRAERAPVLGQVDRLRRGADDRHAGGLEPLRQPERGLPAELHDHPDHAGPAGRPAGGVLGVPDLQHVLEGQRLEVEPVGGVVVGGDRLRVAVDHDGLVAGRAQRHHRVHAGVVELDALPDPVRPGAEDQHLGPVRRARPRSPRRRTSSGTAWPRRTRRRRCRRSCRPGAGRAGAAACGPRPRRPAPAAARRAAGRTARPAWPGAAAPRRAPAPPTISARSSTSAAIWSRNHGSIPPDASAHLGDRGAEPQRPLHGVEPAVVRGAAAPSSVDSRVAPAGSGDGPEAGRLGLHRAHRLVQRLGEVAAEAHRLADRLHRGGQLRVGAGELLEREPRDLHHHVVERRLERGRRLAG